MNAQHNPMTPREIVKRLRKEGWEEFKGKGDHKNFRKEGRLVTVDMGVREIPMGTLRSIFRQAGWAW